MLKARQTSLRMSEFLIHQLDSPGSCATDSRESRSSRRMGSNKYLMTKIELESKLYSWTNRNITKAALQTYTSQMPIRTDHYGSQDVIKGLTCSCDRSLGALIAVDLQVQRTMQAPFKAVDQSYFSHSPAPATNNFKNQQKAQQDECPVTNHLGHPNWPWT